jgi:hypothetical protein
VGSAILGHPLTKALVEAERRLLASPEEFQAALDQTLGPSATVGQLVNAVCHALEDHVRRISVQLRNAADLDAFPTLTGLVESPDKGADKSDVIEIVINHLPLPNDLVPWEALLEYRADPDSMTKFLALRNWMSDIGRANLTPSEIEEKLEYLIDRFEQHMRLHKLKANPSAFETVIVGSAEFLEHLAKFRWGDAAKKLFSLKHKRLMLLEGELTAPGNEIAYIVKARETFENIGSRQTS